MEHESQDGRHLSGLIKNCRFQRLPEGWSWCWLAVLPVAILSALMICGTIGNSQAQNNRRVFGALDPVVDFIRVNGGILARWLFDHAVVVGGIVCAVAVAVAIAGIVTTRKLSLPVVLVCAGVGFVAWGQVSIVEQRFLLGTCLYGCGVACAFGLGIVCPMFRLPGFPPCGNNGQVDLAEYARVSDPSAEVPVESGPVQRAESPRGILQLSKAVLRSAREKADGLRFECLLVVALTMVGLVLRIYGLNELPGGFDDEMIEGMIEARTWDGIKTFVNETFLGSSVGLAQVPTQFISHRNFGTSYFSVRLASVFWGTVTIPLFYWLLRRMIGVLPAMIGTLFFVAAPEQLFWSRSENGQFAPMTFYAVVSGHLALWLACRATWPAALASALWMPAAAFFYFPCITLVALPGLAWAHAVVFARRGWKTARYVLPLLAIGVVLLWFGKSVVIYGVADDEWNLYSPLVVHGNTAWKVHLSYADVSVVDVARHYIETLTTNLPQLARSLTFQDLGATHWCQRWTFGPQPGPPVNIAITALLALGIGFLLGQPRDSRAAVLLFWIALGLVPGVLSDVASPRRIGTIFPAVLAVATIMLAVFWRVAGAVSGPRFAKVVGGLCVLLTAVIAWTNLVSHLSLPIRPVVYAEISDFIRPELDASDTVYHTLDGSFGSAVFFGQLDQLVREKAPCIEFLNERNWPGAALFPQCRFNELYQLLFSRGALEEIRSTYVQRDVSFIIHNRFNTSLTLETLEALKSLYPDAVANARYLRRSDIGEIYAIRVPGAAMSEKRNPVLVTEGAETSGGSAAEDTHRGAWDAVAGQGGAQMNRSARARLMGGFLIQSDDWYRFRVVPTQPEADLRIDGRPVDGPDSQPLLAGAHSLELEFSAGQSAQPQFEIEVRGDRTGVSRLSLVDDLAHPSVVAKPGLQASPVAVFDGYDAFREIATLGDRPVDLGVDGSGRLFVLSWNKRDYKVLRLSADGIVEKEWHPPIRDYEGGCMAVDRDGRVVLVGRDEMLFYSADGHLQLQTPLGFPEAALDVVFLNDGRVLVSVDERHSLELFDGMGRHLDSLRHVDPNTADLGKPLGLAIGPDQRLLVVEGHGRAMLFQTADGEWPPRLERIFGTGMRSPVGSRGCAFDGLNRLIIPDRNSATARIYDRSGNRVMARTSTHDLSMQPIEHPMAFARYENTLFAIDLERGRLVSVEIVDFQNDSPDPGSP
jgi:hypothetical protein